ncbi:MAG: hypothetical protein KF768_05000 [Phycisphaeraceae bacterium]|nr:hypothetical protein [Phycisphaeraceae bacterium]
MLPLSRSIPIARIALLLITASIVSPSLAQPGSGGAQSRPRPTTGAVELGEAFHIDEVGLSVRIPLGCRLESTRIGDIRTAQIMPADGGWIMNIQTPRTERGQTSLADAADHTIRLLQGSVGVLDPEQKVVLQTRARVLERSNNLRINDRDAERFYVSLPRADDVQLVKGYTIFQPSPTQFVVFELIVPESSFGAAKGIYETSVATAKFLDAELVSQERGMAIRAGQELLRLVTPADYDRWLDGQERWYRLSRPAASGAAIDAEEVGYRGVKLWKGQRGEVDPRRNKAAWTRADRQQGFLASVRGRVMTPQGPADSEAVYFMAPDRSEEAWSIRMVLRDRASGRELVTAQELGARTMQDLNIVIEQSGQPPRTLKPYFKSDGYISQVDMLLLPRIFADQGVQSDFAFYGYQPQLEGVSMRRDRVSRAGRGTNVIWTVETNVSEDSPTQTGTFNHKGESLRVTTGEDMVWEPTDIEQLLRLWQQKGLPTSPIRR